MRDLVHKGLTGSLTTEITNSRYTFANRTSVNQTTPGWIRKARSKIVQSDGLRATTYHAYDLSCRGQTAEAEVSFPTSSTNMQTVKYSGSLNAPAISAASDYIHWATFRPLVPQGIQARVRNQLLAKASSIDWNAAQSVAELRSTAQMIAQTTVAALKAAAAAKRGQWGRAWSLISGRGSVPDKAANAYLAVQYGWKPLISDVQGLLKALDSGMRDEELVKVRAQVVESRNAPKSAGVYSKECKWTVGAEGALVFGVKDPELATAASYGLLNPFLLAWDLIPLSFVIDWFVSVGGFLQGLGATIGLDFKTGYITDFARCTNGKITYTTKIGAVPAMDFEYSFNGFAMHRAALLGWPRPRLAVRLGLNLNQLASAIALAQQRL